MAFDRLDQNVLRLDVPVHKLERMQMCDAVRDLSEAVLDIEAFGQLHQVWILKWTFDELIE